MDDYARLRRVALSAAKAQEHGYDPVYAFRTARARMAPQSEPAWHILHRPGPAPTDGEIEPSDLPDEEIGFYLKYGLEGMHRNDTVKRAVWVLSEAARRLGYG